jgi:hypothetical protein
MATGLQRCLAFYHAGKRVVEEIKRQGYRITQPVKIVNIKNRTIFAACSFVCGGARRGGYASNVYRSSYRLWMGCSGVGDYERELAVALLAGCICWRRLLSDFL